jgi:hypothetical protein
MLSFLVLLSSLFSVELIQEIPQLRGNNLKVFRVATWELAWSLSNLLVLLDIVQVWIEPFTVNNEIGGFLIIVEFIEQLSFLLEAKESLKKMVQKLDLLFGFEKFKFFDE